MEKLKPEEINRIEYYGKAVINGNEYRLKDYHYKSEIYKDGALYARIDHGRPQDDPARVEYV